MIERGFLIIEAGIARKSRKSLFNSFWGPPHSQWNILVFWVSFQDFVNIKDKLEMAITSSEVDAPVATGNLPKAFEAIHPESGREKLGNPGCTLGDSSVSRPIMIRQNPSGIARLIREKPTVHRRSRFNICGAGGHG